MADPYGLRDPDISIYGWCAQFRQLVTDAGGEWREPEILWTEDPMWAGWADGPAILFIISLQDTGLWIAGARSEMANAIQNPTDAQLLDAWRRFVQKG